MSNSPKKSKLRWYKGRKIGKIEGKAISSSVRIARDYEKRIGTYFEATIREYEKGLAEKLTQLGYEASVQLPVRQQEQLLDYLEKAGNAFEETTKTFAERVSFAYVAKIDKNATNATTESLKQALGVDPQAVFQSDKVKAKLVTAINENVNLITGLGDDIKKSIESIVNISTTNGAGVRQIFEELQTVQGMSENRARLIANDQTKKITTQIASQRMQDAGIKEWKWVHSGGGISRKKHLELNGQVFKFDEDPPFIDEDDKIRGYPSQLINCKCKMIPIINTEDYAI